MPAVDLVEALEVEALAAEQLHGRHAGDVFLQERVDPRDPSADHAVGLADVPAEPLRDQRDQRQHRERHQRQPPVHPQHHGHDADEREDVAEDRHDARGEEVVQDVDVRGHARHQPADRIPIVVADVEPLQVAVDPHPQVEHDPLAGQLHRPRLDVLGDERDDQNPRIQRRQRPQPLEPALGDVAIDGHLEQIRLRQRGARADEDGHERDQHLPPIGPQVNEQPPHQDGVVGFTQNLVVLHAPYTELRTQNSAPNVNTNGELGTEKRELLRFTMPPAPPPTAASCADRRTARPARSTGRASPARRCGRDRGRRSGRRRGPSRCDARR